MQTLIFDHPLAGCLWLAVLFITAAVLTLLAFRRALDAQVPGFVAALAMVPHLRVLVAAGLAVLTQLSP